jgi:hypothetical protein
LPGEAPFTRLLFAANLSCFKNDDFLALLWGAAISGSCIPHFVSCSCGAMFSGHVKKQISVFVTTEKSKTSIIKKSLHAIFLDH